MVTVYRLYGRRDFLVSFWHCVHKGYLIGLAGDEGDLEEDEAGDETGDEAEEEITEELTEVNDTDGD